MTMKAAQHLKKYSFTIELIVRDPAAVVELGRSYMSKDDWKEHLKEFFPDGDELFAAMSLLFASSHVISAELGEAVEFYRGSSQRDRDVPTDWHNVPIADRFK